MASPFEGAAQPDHARDGARSGVWLTDALLVTMALLWGVNFAVVKYGTSAVTPIAFNGARMLLASAALAVIVLFVGSISAIVLAVPAMMLAKGVCIYLVARLLRSSHGDALDRATLPSGKGVLLAARDSADHIAAGVVAARHKQGSVLPVARGQESLPSATAARVAELGPAWVRAVGGPMAVPDRAVLAALVAADLMQS